MLDEIRAGARKEGGLARRWYSGPDFDLYVWRESTHEIVQFQLAWKRPAMLHDQDHIPEEVIIWSREGGLRKGQVSESGRYRAPILDGGGAAQLQDLIEAFAHEAEQASYPDVRFASRKLQGQQ